MESREDASSASPLLVRSGPGLRWRSWWKLHGVQVALLAAAALPIVWTPFALFSIPTNTFLRSFSQSWAFWSLILIDFELLTGTKIPLFDAVFGLPIMISFHKMVVVVVMSFPVIHVGLVFAAYNQPMTAWEVLSFLFSLTDDVKFVLARAALWLMLIAGVFCAMRRVPDGKGLVPWWLWKTVHFFYYGTAVMAFSHGLLVVLDAKNHQLQWQCIVLACYCFALLAIAVVGRIWGAIRFQQNGVWIVEDARWNEGRSAVVVDLVHKLHKPPANFVDRKPGQFIIVRLKGSNGRWSTPHPFTLSCAPSDPFLQVIIRITPHGKFTGGLSRELRPGSEVLVDGPYGTWAPHLELYANTVLIGGGVGFSPILSVLRFAAANAASIPPSNKITVIYGARNVGDVISLAELGRIIAALGQNRCMIVLVFSDRDALAKAQATPAMWDRVPEAIKAHCYQGFVTQEICSRYVESADAECYLCGPPPMVKLLLGFLTALRISRQHVHYEAFTL